MKHENLMHHRQILAIRDRGRPRTASVALRNNNYRDEKGHYQLAGGLKYWHTRVVDVMLINPHMKVVDLAKQFSVSPEWMGMLLKSDAFIEYYNQRMSRHQGHLHTEIIHKMQNLASMSLDKLEKHLQSPTATFGQTKEAASLVLGSLGYTGGSSKVSVAVTPGQQGSVEVSVSSEILQRAQQKVRLHMQQNTKEIELDKDAYQQVTSSLEVNAEDIPDAMVFDEHKS